MKTETRMPYCQSMRREWCSILQKLILNEQADCQITHKLHSASLIFSWDLPYLDDRRIERYIPFYLTVTSAAHDIFVWGSLQTERLIEMTHVHRVNYLFTFITMWNCRFHFNATFSQSKSTKVGILCGSWCRELRTKKKSSRDHWFSNWT
jgi:hypothetical protein